MRVLADGLALGHRVDYRAAEVLWMWAGEADALDAVDRIACAQQLAELGVERRCEIAAPGVDVLAEQGELAHAFCGEPCHLRDDVARAAAHLTPANGGHDAVGALRVATHRDLHPGLEGAFTVHRQLAGEAAVVEAEASARDTEPARAEPFAEMRNRSRAERDVDVRVELEEALALGFRIAAADGDHLVL